MQGIDASTTIDGLRWNRWSAWWPALALAGALVAARVVYLLWLCPYDLAEDEAFYWDWSRHLAWSYYTKGPGIAWAIAASTEVFGDTEVGVRIVAVISSLVAALGIAGLALDVTRGDRRVALLSVGLMTLSPLFFASAMLSTIDGPFVACWAIAAWAGWRALAGGGWRAWVVLGAALGMGFLFKYTTLFLAGGLLGFAVMHRARVRLGAGWRLGAAVMVALIGLGFAPVIIWNIQNDWGTVKHLLGHVRASGGDRPSVGASGQGWSYNPKWMAELIGTQFGLVGPMVIVMLMGLVATVSRRHDTALVQPADRGARLFLLWCGAPVIGFYLIVSVFSSTQGNWPMATYVSGFVLAASWLVGAWRSGTSQLLWRVTLVYGVVACLGMLRLDWVKAGLERVAPSIGKVVPIHRLMGAAAMARSVDELRIVLRESAGAGGEEPMIITQHYGIASQLGFYLPDRPVVRCAMSAMGGRTVQQDFWPEARLDQANLAGRTAILIALGKSGEGFKPAFERVVPVGGPGGESRLAGDPRPGRYVYIGYGYRGFGALRREVPSNAMGSSGETEDAP